MSSLNARTRHAEPVYLNIYDLSPMNDYIYDIGFGFYHSGVQVHGDEWTFSTSGVFYHRPQQAPNVKFRIQVLLGTVNYTSSKVKDIINSLLIKKYNSHNKLSIQKSYTLANANHSKKFDQKDTSLTRRGDAP